MTIPEVKELTLWMQSQGVQQFQWDGMMVVFHPRSLKMGAAATQGEPVKDYIREDEMTMEKLFEKQGGVDLDAEIS